MTILDLRPPAASSPTIRVLRGTARPITFTFTLNASAVNLTGKTVTLTVKADETAAGAEVYSLDQTSHTDAVNGVTLLTIPASATFGTDGTLTTFFYEVRLMPDDVVYFKGELEVYPTPAPL